ncbi:MAG: hypothetical protein EZS28_015103 [Streblomastix strix]|uniref:C2 domain-containing protein n=1 Tax=Streblomastix strix TaxID=222440 RepID=A0A5J4W3F7_9EUKA|nr:MAG: hypothetical protein EZS28_015103 [Streblomastix strix]
MGGSESKQNDAGTKLYITVYKAVNLRAGTMRRPFVKLIVGNKNITTSFGRGIRPMFMERFCFDYEALDGEVVAQVWDSGICFSNEFLGEVSFPAEPFLQSEKRRTFKLYTDKYGYQGSLHLSVFLCPAGFTTEKKDTKKSVITDGIVQPAKPLFSPANAQTPVLPYYCRINFPPPENIIERPKDFGLFLMNKRNEAKATEKAETDKLKMAILQLNREKQACGDEDKDAQEQIAIRLETTLAHAQIAADVPFLELDQTEDQARDVVEELAKVEWENFLRTKQKLEELAQRREEVKKLKIQQKEERRKERERLMQAEQDKRAAGQGGDGTADGDDEEEDSDDDDAQNTGQGNSSSSSGTSQ